MVRNRKSQSQVITTVLIILLVLAAVFIVYIAVRNMIKSGTDSADTSKFDVELTTLKPCLVSGDNYIPVTRKSGTGNISEIRILFKDSSGKQVCNTYSNKTTVPKELETVIYSVDLTGCNAVSYEVYPVLISGGKEVIGMKAVESGSGCNAYVPPVVPPITGDVIEIDSCADSPLNQDGKTYKLVNDISSSGTCLTITADDVVLDGNGKQFTIESTKGSAIVFEGDSQGNIIKNAVIKAGTFSYNTWEGCDDSIYYCSGIAFGGASSNNLIDGNDITQLNSPYNPPAGGAIGFFSTSENDIILHNNLHSFLDSGIVFASISTYYNIAGNTIHGGVGNSGSEYGTCYDYTNFCSPIAFVGAANNGIIDNNNLSQKGNEGGNVFYRSTSSYNKITNNYMDSTYSMSGSGVKYIGNADYDVLDNNTINAAYSGVSSTFGGVINNTNITNNNIGSSYVGSYGMSFWGGVNYCLIANNTMDGSYGIDTNSCSYNTFDNNIITSISSYNPSLYFGSCSNNLVINNIMISDGKAVIWDPFSSGTSYNLFTNNTLIANHGSGIIFGGASSNNVINGSNVINTGVENCDNDNTYDCSGVVFASSSVNDVISGKDAATQNIISSPHGYGIYFGVTPVPAPPNTQWNDITSALDEVYYSLV